jgi:hypothetical protein
VDDIAYRRYAHNTGVEGNGPVGAATRAVQRSAHQQPAPGCIGPVNARSTRKVLNFYGRCPTAIRIVIPPAGEGIGRRSWARTDPLLYGYSLNDNGALMACTATSRTPRRTIRAAPSRRAGDAGNYQTDVLTNGQWIRSANPPRSEGRSSSLDYIAWHGDYQPPSAPEPPRHNSLAFAGPRPPGFNEGNVRQSSFICSAPR